MEQDNKDKKSNTGCAIAIGIFVLVNIVCYLVTSSKQEIAGTGAFFLSIVFLATAYFVIKAYLRHTKGSDNKFVHIGIPLVVFIALMLLLGAIIKDFSAMLVIGSIGFIVFCIIIGMLIYNSYKDS